MKNKEQFDWALGVLVEAYMRGDLNAHDCRVCAVGNLLGHGEWVGNSIEKIIRGCPLRTEIKFLGSSNKSGYSAEELCLIETAFLKGVDYGHNDEITDEGNFKGLMAVVDVLQEIHECTEKEVIEAKALFVK